MTIKMTLLAVGAAVILPLAASAAPDGAQGGFRHHGGGHFPFLQGVTLTDAQKTQIHTIMQTDRTSEKATFEQLHALHKQISDALTQAGSVNESQLASLQQQASTLRDQLDTQHLHTAIQVRALLTTAQLSQAAQTHAQLEALHQQEHQIMSQGHDSAQ